MPSTIAFIFARGGSKGVPGKNVRHLAGRPLIAHAVAAARGAAVDRVVVSTDDEAIAAAARAAGAEVPFMRPADLAADDAPEWLAWRHAIDAVEAETGPFSLFVSVPATAPLRLPGDVDACIERFARGDIDMVVTVTPAHNNPYFNMLTVDEEGRAGLVIPPGGDGPTRRQDAPEVYDMTTVCYVTTPGFVRRAAGVLDGRVGAVVIPRERALDIDTELDFRIAEMLMAQREDPSR